MAGIRYFLQIAIHALVARHGQYYTFLYTSRMWLVLLNYHAWNVKQRYVAHVVRLFPCLAYPILTVGIHGYVFVFQVLDVCKRQTGEGTKQENVAYNSKARYVKVLVYYQLQFIFCKKRPVAFRQLKMNAEERVFGYPSVG